MRKISVLKITTLAIMTFLAGCAGGGSSTGGTSTGTTPQPSNTVITGVAAKGVIAGGIINIYAPSSAGDLSGRILLKSTSTDNSGRFNVELGSYSGIVEVEVSGTYTDEATGSQLSIGAGTLRAAAVVGNAGDTVAVTVTPLTELAVRHALSGTFLTEASVKAANALISNLFQIDIMAVAPVAANLPAMTTASQAQKDYTIMLAAISKWAASAGSLQAVLDACDHDLSATNRLSAATAAQFQAALQSFLSDSVHNQTGVTVASQALADVGKFTGVLTLSTQGTATAPITSLQATVTLPAGVAVKRDASGALMASASGVAAQAAAFGKNLTSPTTLVLALISSPGFGVGEFASITYVADPGVIPTASDFAIGNVAITGFDGTNSFSIPLSVVPALK
ncbi:hypothetical protein GMSM_37920 [Geomonas sp. Red276]